MGLPCARLLIKGSGVASRHELSSRTTGKANEVLSADQKSVCLNYFSLIARGHHEVVARTAEI